MDLIMLSPLISIFVGTAVGVILETIVMNIVTRKARRGIK